MNPETNRFEELREAANLEPRLDKAELDSLRGKLAQAVEQERLLRPDGTPVPKHWSVFQVGEQVVVKDYTFKVAYIGESTLLLEPVGLPVVGGDHAAGGMERGK